MNGVTGLLGNPLFMMGAGLLSSPSNPWGGAMQGLLSSQAYDWKQSKQRLDDEQAARQAQIEQMQIQSLRDSKQREDITRAMTSAINMNPGAYQSPEAQQMLRTHLAGWGDTKMAEQAGVLPPLAPAAGTYGTTPHFDRDGNAWQLSSTGAPVKIPVPIQRPLNMTDLGGYIAGVNPITGAQEKVMNKTLPPEQTPATKKAQAAATETGRAEAQRVIMAPQQVAKANMIMESIDNVIATARKASGEVDWANTGVANSLTGWIPQSPAYDLNKTVTTIKVNIGFDRLQQMRDASPTGGALGQVAIQELDALQASIGSLDTRQSPSQMRENIGKVIKHYQRWRSSVNEAKVLAENNIPERQTDQVLRFNQSTGEFE